MNLFKNCSYYWGFAGYISYHVNHPLYTSPSSAQVSHEFITVCFFPTLLLNFFLFDSTFFQVYTGLGFFLICELGNFACHLLFRFCMLAMPMVNVVVMF